MRITSRDNSLLRLARAVRDGKADDLIFVEGLRLCEEALRSELQITAVIFSEELAKKERAKPLIDRVVNQSDRAASVSEKLLESISFTKTPQGIVALAKRPVIGADLFDARLSRSPLLVVMHQINNPVNVGAIIRTTEAAGATAAIATLNTADPFSPKALRGAMGSAFRLPIWIGPNYNTVLEWCRARQITTVCADAKASTLLSEVDWTKPTGLILGPESVGLSQKEKEMADLLVSIPMEGSVESLNVSVAAGILLFEAAQQRRGN